MNYTDRTLTFESDKIYYSDETTTFEVMMSWEDSLMSASAAYICEGGGDILEIGFGMGISAGYIQSQSISSHTIIENHPQIIEKANAWAVGKSNVTIVEGDWFTNKNSLLTYDGIFYDTYGDTNMNNFSSSLNSLTKAGAHVTWWNNNNSATNYYNIPNVTYQEISVSPQTNGYFNSSTYYLPKRRF